MTWKNSRSVSVSQVLHRDNANAGPEWAAMSGGYAPILPQTPNVSSVSLYSWLACQYQVAVPAKATASDRMNHGSRPIDQRRACHPA